MPPDGVSYENWVSSHMKSAEHKCHLSSPELPVSIATTCYILLMFQPFPSQNHRFQKAQVCDKVYITCCWDLEVNLLQMEVLTSGT